MKATEFKKGDLVRYKENRVDKWQHGRVIIEEENTITLRMINEDVVVLRKDNLTRDVIRHRTQ
jgi:hypothetical protein